MKRIITISGDIGSGKSSVASALKELTQFEILGTGNIQRAIAKQRGITTLELNKISQSDRSIDDEIDSFVINTGNTKSNLIIDSRLAWHFIPNAFKIYLSVDPKVGAERVFSAQRTTENNTSIEQTLNDNEERQQLEDKRFLKLYNVNFRNHDNYDLTIDTSHTLPQQTAEKINIYFEQWLLKGN